MAMLTVTAAITTNPALSSADCVRSLPSERHPPRAIGAPFSKEHKDCASFITNKLHVARNSMLIPLTYLLRNWRIAAFFRTSVTKETKKIANRFSKIALLDYIGVTRTVVSKDCWEKPREFASTPHRNQIVKIFGHAVSWRLAYLMLLRTPY